MTDPYASLRDNVRLLGSLLGDTLKEQVGEKLYDTVERVRALSKSARTGSNESFNELTRVLASLPVEEELLVARAFSHFLNLANIAEQHHRVRRRLQYQRDPESSPQQGSCEETFSSLIKSGI